LCLVEEILERRAQGFAIEIARAGHIETSRLQGLGNKARVIGRCGERARLVGGVADHEGDTFFRFRPRRQGESQRDERQSERDASQPQCGCDFHNDLCTG